MKRFLKFGIFGVLVAVFLAVTLPRGTSTAHASTNATPIAVGTASTLIVPQGNAGVGWVVNVGATNILYCNVGHTVTNASSTNYDFQLAAGGGTWFLPCAPFVPDKVGSSRCIPDAIYCNTSTSTSTANFYKR